MADSEYRARRNRLIATVIALIALTLASWALGQVTGEVTAPIVAFGIAIAKSLLVLFVFMELRAGGTTSWVAGLTSVLFIGLLVAGAVLDVATR